MSDIKRREDLNKTAGTEADFSTRLRDRLGAKFLPNAISCILADISGSMYGEPIRKLRELMDGLDSNRRFIFDSAAEELKPGQKIPEPRGTTNMTDAFKLLKKEGINHVVMITDGSPDNKQTALEESDGLRIDIFYVGAGEATDFLKDLAHKTGGKFGQRNLKDHLQLQTEISGLLEPPKSTIAL